MSSFSGLQIAQRALAAQLRSMEVAGQNIANANTPGYSRQVAVHSTVVSAGTVAARSGLDSLGLSGVEVAQIRRQYDGFLDDRVRHLTAENSGVAARHDVLSRLEELLREPGDATVGTALEAFWTSFTELATNPPNDAYRNNVLYQASAVGQSFRDVASEIGALRAELGERAQRDVERINALAQSLAQVNVRIVASAPVSGGEAPNALLDQRDGLLRELARYADIRVREGAYGDVQLLVGGRTLVDGAQAAKLACGVVGDRLILSLANVVISGADVGGLVGGEFAAYNEDIPRHAGLLDSLAEAVITQVNAVHAQGFDSNGNSGQAFFSGNSALTIAVSGGLQGNPGLVAASAAADGSDGVQAQRLADLRWQPPFGDTSLTFQYGSLISQLGSETASLAVARENSQLLMEFAEARKEAVSGVSLDDELTDLIRFQQAYAAAARTLTAMDEALDILINRTGLVGR